MINSSQFTYVPETKTLVAEISDFGRDFRFEQIYDDACDEGVSVLSDRTGRVAKFAVTQHEKDREGDLTAWVLTPIRESLRVMPELAGVTIKIFND